MCVNNMWVTAMHCHALEEKWDMYTDFIYTHNNEYEYVHVCVNNILYVNVCHWRLSYFHWKLDKCATLNHAPETGAHIRGSMLVLSLQLA